MASACHFCNDFFHFVEVVRESPEKNKETWFIVHRILLPHKTRVSPMGRKASNIHGSRGDTQEISTIVFLME